MNRANPASEKQVIAEIETSSVADRMTVASFRIPWQHRPLPANVLRDLADLARIPDNRRTAFYDNVHWTIALAWVRDRRSLGSKPGKALQRAAIAARKLYDAVTNMESDDRDWVEQLRRRTPKYRTKLSEFPETIYLFAHLLSSAANMSPPRPAGVAPPSHQKSKRNRSLKNVMFFDFVGRLRFVAEDSGGNLGLGTNHKGGNLVKAIHLLRPHLPNDLVPDRLAPGTLKKIRADKPVDGPPVRILFHPRTKLTFEDQLKNVRDPFRRQYSRTMSPPRSQRRGRDRPSPCGHLEELSWKTPNLPTAFATHP
jgi:hypothetical protein